jgi:DnaJ-class molecular chaperone
MDGKTNGWISSEMCDGTGRINTLDDQPCAECNGTGKHSVNEDKAEFVKVTKD